MGNKILSLILFAVLLSSCKYFRPHVEAPKDDFLKVPTYNAETASNTKTVYEPAQVYSGDVSYWYVVTLATNSSGTVYYSCFLKQDHRYFSLSEVKAGFKEKVMVMNFIQVSKETYEENN